MTTNSIQEQIEEPDAGSRNHSRHRHITNQQSPSRKPCGGTGMRLQKHQLKTPDPLGLAVARAAQQAAEPNTVILFGSRARGDHRQNSDVDLLVICQSNSAVSTASIKRAAKEYFELHPPQRGVDIITMNKEKFEYARRSKNHVAGQALRDGIIMSGERLDFSNRYEDDYPDSWPDVKDRISATYRQLNSLEILFNHPGGAQEDYGFHAQQAVENGMKAWLSAADIGYRLNHDLQEAAELILNDPTESQTLAAQQLRLLIDYTTFEEPDHPSKYDNWLTKYAVTYRYEGTGFHIEDLAKTGFRQEIMAAALTFVNRAHELCGTDDSDLQ